MKPIIRPAEILCVGTELLLGDIVNTNAAYLSGQLAALGIGVYRHTAVGDNPGRLTAALRSALDSADLVITSGGLGPTYDDLTKETVALTARWRCTRSRSARLRNISAAPDGS